MEKQAKPISEHPSVSRVQSKIEKEMLEELEKQHCLDDWRVVHWKDIAGERELVRNVKPDGVWLDGEGRIILAECYVRIGALGTGHRRKLAMDTLKLITMRKELSERSVDLLLVVPNELGERLDGNDWLSMVIRRELQVVRMTLTDGQRERLNEAVKRQAEGQARMPKKGS